MYHWIDSRNFSASKNLQALNLISRTSNHLLRSKFDLNNFNRLPVIKEEGVNPEEEEVDLQQNLLRSVFQNHYRSRKGAHMKDPIDMKNFERILKSKSITRLPPLASINHLMGTSIKDTEKVWETQFGKCLMNGKNSGDLNLYRVRASLTSNAKEECGDFQPLKCLSSRRSFHDLNAKNVAGDKPELGQTKTNRKLKNIQTSGKKFGQEKPQVEKLFEGSLAVKSFNKSQHLLPENTQSTLDSHSNEINNKNVIKILSNERFSNPEELSRQKKRSETKKEICQLCEKPFFDPQQYAQHLLTHETADKFTCKMCKIHFLSLRKYKQHCRDFHFTLSSVIKKQNFEDKKKWTPKFECKRCKAVFEMEQNFETHKRIHSEKDLSEKCHLSSKNT